MGGRNLDRVRGIATEQRPYAQGAIDSVVLQDIASFLEDIRDTTMGPDIFRQYGFPVTDSTRILDFPTIQTMPWMGFTLCNDGPGPVYVFVNDKVNIQEQRIVEGQGTNVAPVRKGEMIKFNMKRSGIERIFLQCATGEIANVRIYSEGKRWARGVINA